MGVEHKHRCATLNSCLQSAKPGRVMCFLASGHGLGPSALRCRRSIDARSALCGQRGLAQCLQLIKHVRYGRFLRRSSAQRSAIFANCAACSGGQAPASLAVNRVWLSSASSTCSCMMRSTQRPHHLAQPPFNTQFKSLYATHTGAHLQ